MLLCVWGACIAHVWEASHISAFPKKGKNPELRNAENLQRGEEQQPCELGELSLGLLTEGSCRQRAEGRALAAPASAVLLLGGLG